MALEAACPDVTLTICDRTDDPASVADCELIILAAPISENLRIIEALRPLVGANTLITDTGSTKVETVAAAAGLRFVGGHPIAGAATGGRAAARPDLFEGKNWVLTPGPEADPADVSRLTTFIESLGALVIVTSPEAHDRLFAFISHLPQLTVSALMDVVGRQAGVAGLSLAGAGLRDSTRLASSPSDIWCDIVTTNRPQVVEALNQLIATLETLRDDESGEVLKKMFASAAEWKRVLG